MGALAILPMILYMAIFQIHFSYQTQEPDYRNSVQAEIDLSLLTPDMRYDLKANYPEDREEIWRDVVYGSVVQLQSRQHPGVYLHSFNQINPGGSRQQQVGGYVYPDLNTHWIVIRADMDEDDPQEIPSRIQYLKNGDYLRLRHVPTRRCLHSHNLRTYTDPNNKNMNEVTAYGAYTFDGDANDWWMVETVNPLTRKAIVTADDQEQQPVRALETSFRLQHVELGCYLTASDSVLPESWGKGRNEIICRTEASVTPKSIWSITMNDHDYCNAKAAMSSE